MPMPTRHITLRDDLRALPFLLPFLAVFALFIGWPLFYSIWISLHEVTIYSDFYDLFGTMNFVGFENYRRIATDPIFWWSVFLTFCYAGLTIIPGMILSLALALLLNRKLRGMGLLRSGFFLPNVFDVYVVGVIWLLLYNPQGGLVSAVLRLLGFTGTADAGVLSSPMLTLPAIALAMILKNAGFGMILFLTSLNNINESIFEAADVDGATPWQKLIHVTIPMLRPIIFFLGVTGTVGALNAFAEIFAMTDATGGTSVPVTIPFTDTQMTFQSARISGFYLYQVFSASRYGEAAAMSFLLLLIAVSISGLAWVLTRPRTR